MAVTTKCIRSPAEWQSVVAELTPQKLFSFDTEYENRGYPNILPVGFSVSWRVGKNQYRRAYVPLNHKEKRGEEMVRIPNQLTPDQVKKGLQSLVGKGRRWAMHNAQADLKILHLMGVDTDGIELFDTMIASWLLETDRDGGHGLDNLTLRFFDYQMTELTDFAPWEMAEDTSKPPLKGGPRKGLYRLKKTGILLVSHAPLKEMLIYAPDDAYYTLRLARKFSQDLVSAKHERIFYDLLMEVVEYLCEMEEHGLPINRKGLRLYVKQLKKEIRRAERKLFDQRPGEKRGEPFSINSPKQVNEVLFGAYTIESKKHFLPSGKPKKIVKFDVERSEFGIIPYGVPGKSGYYTANAEAMEMYAADGHYIATLITEVVGLKHLLGMVQGWLKRAVRHNDGRWYLHGNFNQHGTRTGRLSSNDPNLQNIPVRNKERPVRQFFIAPKGYKFADGDYAQIELKLLAHFSEDKRMCDIMNRGGDLHSETAVMAYHVKVPKELTDLKARGKWVKEHHEDLRGKSKGVNFGTVYGIGPPGLVRKQGMTLEEAKDFLARHPKMFPEAHQYIARQKRFAKKHGYVRTLFGRKRHLPDARIDMQRLGSRGANEEYRKLMWRRLGGAERRAVNSPIQGSAADVIAKAMRDIRRYFKAKDWWYKKLNEDHPFWFPKVIPGAQVHDELVFFLHESVAEEALAKIVELMNKAVKLIVPTEAEAALGANWAEAKG